MHYKSPCINAVLQVGLNISLIYLDYYIISRESDRALLKTYYQVLKASMFFGTYFWTIKSEQNVSANTVCDMISDSIKNLDGDYFQVLV